MVRVPYPDGLTLHLIDRGLVPTSTWQVPRVSDTPLFSGIDQWLTTHYNARIVKTYSGPGPGGSQWFIEFPNEHQAVMFRLKHG